MWALISNIDDDLANCCKVIQYSVPHIYADLDFAIVLVLNLIARTVRSLLTEELTLMYIYNLKQPVHKAWFIGKIYWSTVHKGPF